MIHQNFFPSRLAQQAIWLNNFKGKLPGHNATLGLPAGEVTAIVGDCLWLIYVIGSWLGALRTFGQSGTQYLTLIQTGTVGASPLAAPIFNVPAIPVGTAAVIPGALNRLFDFVQKIKAVAPPGYTDAIGEDLGIIGPEENPDDHPVPKFSLEGITGPGGTAQVRINFFKYTHQGVYLESRRNGGAWEFLAIDTERPYLDERPLLVAGTPEVREYRMRYWDKGTPNGPWTDVAKITVGP